MFKEITEAKDREEFFVLARVLCWSDGDCDEQERKVMSLLEDLNAQQDAQVLLTRSRQIVEEIELNKDQWSEQGRGDEKPFFDFLGGILKKAS